MEIIHKDDYVGNPDEPDTRSIFVIVDSKDICFFDATVQAYEGMAVSRTRNAQLGLVEVWVSPQYFDEFLRILAEDISQEVDLKIVNID